MKNHLEQDKLKVQGFLRANDNRHYLNSVLSKSLQEVTEDPQKLLREAERLDLTTEIVLDASPGLSISTPSKLSTSASHIQKTSTPKSKKAS